MSTRNNKEKDGVGGGASPNSERGDADPFLPPPGTKSIWPGVLCNIPSFSDTGERKLSPRRRSPSLFARVRQETPEPDQEEVEAEYSPPMPPRRYLSRKEAAAWLGVSVDTFNRLVIPFVDVGPRCRRWDVEDIIAYAESRKHPHKPR